MIDIHKVGIGFTIILVAFYSGICFTTIPVNADIRINFLPYQPDIIYLGRQSYLESVGLPSDLEDPAPQYIYALVHDAYGKIVNGSLSYTAFTNTNTTILHTTTDMMLINGIPTNGTWRGEIQKPKINVPYTVLYTACFRDDLKYSVCRSGPYYNHNYYTGNDYNIANRIGYNVTYRYIEASQNQGIHQNTTGFTAMVSDNRTNMPYEVTLHYKLNNTKSYQWHDTTMHPVMDYTTMKPYPTENESSGIIHKFYETSLTIPPHTKVIQFYPTLHDSEGSINSPYLSYSSISSLLSGAISIKTDVSKVDVDNDIVYMRIILDGPLLGPHQGVQKTSISFLQTTTTIVHIIYQLLSLVRQKSFIQKIFILFTLTQEVVV